MSNSDDSTRSGKANKPVIRVQRRRPSGEASGAPRERAEAPRREGRSERSAAPASPQATPSRPTTSQGSSGQALLGQALRRVASSAGSGGGTRRGAGGCASSSRVVWLLLILGLLLLCVVGTIWLLSGGLGQDTGLAPADDQSAAPLSTSVFPNAAPVFSAPPHTAPTSKPFVAPPTSSAPGSSPANSWLVMLYQDADDKVLEKDIYVDLNEAERVGSSDNVRIVAQLDRFSGGYAEDGNWVSTKRFYVTQDDDLQRVGSELVADLGEQNMADGETLVDFVTWAVETFPSEKLVLILSDHGMGWPGGWSDPAPATRERGDTPLSEAVGNQLYLNELDAALQTIRERAGVDKFEMIGMDACLMGQLEVFSMLEPHARYAVASEETEPALGWAYTSFLEALTANPAMGGSELGQIIVNGYIREDQRIVDDVARAELMRQGSPMGGMFGVGAPSSAQVASQMGRDVTLSAVDLAQLPALTASFNALCVALQGADQRQVAQARSYAQSFTNIFGQQVPPSYVDLGNFCQLLQQGNPGAAVDSAASQVLAALKGAVVAEKHGPGKPGATGVAIYFPNSTLFRTPATGPTSYTAIASRFAGISLWDDYLAFHYTGREFEAGAQQAAVPPASAPITAPGQGKITVSKVRASDTVAAPGSPVVLSVDITAQNLGHVLLFAGYLDSEANSLYVADMDYLESADTRQVDGVYYPVWPQTKFTLEFEWEPLVFYISDGTDAVPALLTPATYGAIGEEAVYTVDGVYTFATGESLPARLYFQNGTLRQVVGFTGSNAAGAPREIHPQTNDRFTVVERWLDMDAQGRVVNRATEQGGTLTFRDQMFTWQELDAAVGDYVVGFIAVDLDGEQRQVYTQVTVE